MSGLDENVRFYSVGVSNTAIPLDGDFTAYPNFSSAAYSSEVYPQDVEGVLGLGGYRFYSYDPDLVPVRTLSYKFLQERSNFDAMPGFTALFYGDYTIDFWIKVTGSGYSPIFANPYMYTALGQRTEYVLYYENGVLGQRQGSNLHIKCSTDLTGSFHHVEFNRSGGVNRIFVDGVLQSLTLDVWYPLRPFGDDPSGWQWGVTAYGYRNIDYILSGVRYTTGIAQHTENFTPPIEAYTFEYLQDLYLYISETGTNDVYSGTFRSSDPVLLQISLGGINISTNVITKIGHGFVNGDSVWAYSVCSTMPGGLVSGQLYYIVNVSGDTFKLSLTLGGQPVDITDQGACSLLLLKTNALVTIQTDIRFYESKLVTGTIITNLGLERIRSPIDAEISLYCFSGLEALVWDSQERIASPTNALIRFQLDLSLEVSLDTSDHITVPAITDGRIRFEILSSLIAENYGLTVPAITDGSIDLESVSSMDMDLIPSNVVITLEPGTIYDLINNALQLPVSLSSSIILDIGTSIPPAWQFDLFNALCAESGFNFLNALNSDVATQFLFQNAMTDDCVVLFRFKNEILPYNRVEKRYSLLNRLIGLSSPQQYEGFTFTPSHGV